MTIFGETLARERSFCYPVLSELPVNPNKYDGEQQNPTETQRRLTKLPIIQIFSDAVCQELDIKEVKLEVIGSVRGGCARPSSDLDLCIKEQANHPLLLDRRLRQIYSRKMQFLLQSSTKIDFPVSIVFIGK